MFVFLLKLNINFIDLLLIYLLIFLGVGAIYSTLKFYIGLRVKNKHKVLNHISTKNIETIYIEVKKCKSFDFYLRFNF